VETTHYEGIISNTTRTRVVVFELHSDILLKHLKICQLQTQIQTPQEELVNNESPSSLHITLINILGANENKLSVT